VDSPEVEFFTDDKGKVIYIILYEEGLSRKGTRNNRRPGSGRRNSQRYKRKKQRCDTGNCSH
jgi:hypothetical protein